MSESFNFGKSFQLSILKLMLSESVFCSKCIKYLKEEYFQDEVLGWFFVNIKNHYNEYKKPPDEITICNDIISRISEDKKSEYITLFKNGICAASSGNNTYIKKCITKFVKANAFKEMHIVQRDFYNNGQLEKACDYTLDKISQINRMDFFEDSAVNVDDIEGLLQYLRERNKTKIPLGIPILDSLIAGGLPKQSVHTVLAGYGVGKTSFLINVAVEAARKGIKTLFTYHEGRTEQIVARFLSKITRIPFNTFLTLDIEIHKEKIERAKKLLKDNILIKPMCQVGITVEDVYEYAKEKQKDFPFDLLISDYGQELDPRQGFREKRHNISKVWTIFDQMASELDIVILTAAQFNREGVKKSKRGMTVVRSDNISECINIAQKSEIILTLNPYKDGTIICLDKQRDGPTGNLIYCESKMNCIMFYDKTLEQKIITLEEVENGGPVLEETAIMNV